MKLEGKIAIVTGAASGFGDAIARRFAAEGAQVMISDINEEAGTRVAGEIGAAAGFCRADVSKPADVAAMVDATVEAFGGLDIIVNNAGTTHRNRPMLEVGEDEFDRIYAVNVKSIYNAAIAGVPALKARGGGVILNIASTAGVRPRPGLVWYNGSKGAAITLTKAMAVELAPDNIRVVALNPVAGETPMLALFMGEDTEEKRAAFRATVPLGRLSTPQDIANAAAFLVSDEANFLTGVCLEVDGGRCI
ncbi:SDR family oxidoreductase [Rhodobium gokarnense]|uniref:3-oxoacyl-[acyl-carrier protein] reductase n=1 Tax=Rhodobium gokarnense TaxID=364296 RepID=A0ABT3HEM0_9HYPH|nr:SDR family oxidoreductase [Rhodobium gokarnense]MCW2308779.1 3-oxoacyl-[acyl-carrier protein] reductase [Rhodobium gokarnense]